MGEYPDGKNPFGDDEDDEELSTPVQANLAIVVNDTSEQKCVEKEKETSTNPFGSDLDSDEEEEAKCRQPSATTSSPAVSAANSSLNPFGSDLSDEEEAPSSPSPSVRSATRKKRRAPLPPGAPGALGAPPTPAPRLSLGLSSSSSPGSPARGTRKGGTAKRLKDADNLQRRSQIMESINNQQQQQQQLLPSSPLVASTI